MLQQFRLPIADADADVTIDSRQPTSSDGRVPPSVARASRACETFNDCVYSQPRRKKRRSAQADRIEHLEKRLKAVEESCQQKTVPTGALTRLSPIGPTDVAESNGESLSSGPGSSNAIEHHSNAKAPTTLGNQGEARFWHSAAHMDFVRRLKDELGNWPGADAENRVRARNVAAPKLFSPLRNDSPQLISLPSQDRAQYLVNLALDAHFLHNFIHRPTFDSVFALLFTLDVKDYTAEEYKYLPLLLSLMAVGCLFEVNDEDSREAFVLEGTQYFEACRSVVDLQDCSDLVTLQAILYLDIFLLYTARMSSCFSALSYTFSLALRMKLHQTTDTDSVVIREDKKRVFWTTRHLLACVSITGGLPMPLGGDDLDLEYPSTDEPVASVACFRLHNILGHVTKRLYPSKGVKKAQGQGPLHHLVSIETVRELEGELRSWLASLPSGYRLGQQNHAPHIERAKYELCMSYAHAQIYLYRPFLHYLVTSPTDGIAAEDGFPAYASACVDASRNIIRLAQDMHRRGLLRGIQWDISNIILAASLTMLYILLARKERALRSGLVEEHSADGLSRRPLGSVRREENNTQEPSAFIGTQAPDPSNTSFAMLPGQGMSDTPLMSGGLTLDPTFTQDYGVNVEYMIDATGPIDFSDMIGNLFTSEGVL
ncbi:hypothetical protein BBP40_011939 [Aspergillus hancockii]|nr:hypothetical protein BBP40_011939 [Aspergillus hancockii]